jgi:hypothetical protein
MIQSKRKKRLLQQQLKIYRLPHDELRMQQWLEQLMEIYKHYFLVLE